MNEHPVRHLNQVELARRWSLSPRTLERWRCCGQGPCFLKIGGRVVYRLDDIEALEAEQRRTMRRGTAGRPETRCAPRPPDPALDLPGSSNVPIGITRTHGADNGFAHRHG